MNISGILDKVSGKKGIPEKRQKLHAIRGKRADRTPQGNHLIKTGHIVQQLKRRML